MAIIHPEGWRELAATGAGQREVETLQTLSEGLPDAYTVYHGVHWSRVQQGAAVFGEVDFAVVSPAGRILLIEQKSGFLEESPEGLVKRYAQAEKRVPVQLARSRDALLARLIKLAGPDRVHLDALLYCPDYTVKSPGTAGLDPARIVDAGRRGHLAAIIRSLLPEDEAAGGLADTVHRFLRDELRLVPDVNAVVGESRVLYTRLSGGLAHWARQIECEPFRLRVTGTAGSGKTQLALAVLRDAIAQGRRPLYVCYNRPLADHIALIAPEGAMVATYHQLCDRILRSTGQTPDFSRPGAFRVLEAFMAAFDPKTAPHPCPLPRGGEGGMESLRDAPSNEAWLFDELIVDEGQDFQAEWRDNLLRLLRPAGRAWWLEDPMQNLYGRPPVELPCWVTLHADTNYRSPRDILDTLNRLLSPNRPVEAGSPLTGSEVEILTYAGPAELMERTKTAITRGLGAGFRKSMIALVTFRGREHSLFTPLDTLGPHALKAYTGQYDLLGNPIYSEGEVFIDSVYRFKGQSAPCIVFTEIDFEALDEAALRKLFVGMTRASMKLIMVVSERAALALIERLDAGKDR